MEHSSITRQFLSQRPFVLCAIAIGGTGGLSLHSATSARVEFSSAQPAPVSSEQQKFAEFAAPLASEPVAVLVQSTLNFGLDSAAAQARPVFATRGMTMRTGYRSDNRPAARQSGPLVSASLAAPVDSTSESVAPSRERSIATTDFSDLLPEAQPSSAPAEVVPSTAPSTATAQMPVVTDPAIEPASVREAQLLFSTASAPLALSTSLTNSAAGLIDHSPSQISQSQQAPLDSPVPSDLNQAPASPAATLGLAEIPLAADGVHALEPAAIAAVTPALAAVSPANSAGALSAPSESIRELSPPAIPSAAPPESSLTPKAEPAPAGSAILTPAVPALPLLAIARTSWSLPSGQQTPDLNAPPATRLVPATHQSARTKTAPGNTRTNKYRITGNGIEFNIQLVADGDTLGFVPLRVSANGQLTLRLRDLLGLLEPRFDPTEYQRLASSSNAEEFITFQLLRDFGVDLRYDAAHDRLKLDSGG